MLKKLDFSQLWVWKRAVCFLPHKIISFQQKNIKLVRNTEIKAGPSQTGSNASFPTNHFNSQTYFLRVLGILTSWILFNMANHNVPPTSWLLDMLNCSSRLGRIGIVFISSTFKILPVIFKPIISREHIPDPGNRTGEVRNSKTSQTRDLYCATLNANPPSLRGEKFGWKGTNFISMQLLLFFGIHDLQNVNPPLTSLNYRYTTVCHPFFKVRRSK